MAHNRLKQWPVWVITLALLVTSPLLLPSEHAAPSNGSETLEDLGELQQDIRLLKVTLERLKLQRELANLQPTHAIVTEICHPGDGIGTLTLNAIYGVKQRYVATFAYNSTTQIEASRGESLLCGETVRSIGLDRVEVEKNGKRYRITGNVTIAPPQAPPQAPPLLPPQLVQ